MARSDKNTDQGVAGGNSAQPTQSLSETASSTVAGQLLNTLKADKSKPATSHEARLGMMVITILVFAFGFLVYHKMDMHQRKLTQAAIGPGGVAVTELSEINPVAELIKQQPEAAATDPLVNIADLSDGSPFANFEPDLAEPVLAKPVEQAATVHAELTQFESADSRNKVAFSEPVTNPTPVFQDFSLSEPILPEPSAVADISEAETEPQMESLALLPEPTPTFAELEAAPSVEVSPEIVPEAISQTLSGLPNVSFESVDVVLSSSEPESIPESVPEPVREPVEEPILLALAEPVAPDPQVDEFPAFDPIPSERRHESHEKHHQSDSRGFNAVKNPNERKKGNTIRTAAGSGSDGKFSLAAFNYQNGAAEAAPDDGSTFNSVVVQNGDNYTKISQRVYGTVKYFAALAVFNQHRITEPKNMRPGMVVLVPAKEVLEERYPELFVDSKPRAQEIGEFLLLEDGSPAYRVGERETISEISGRFLGRSSRWIEIYRLNQSVLKDPNKLKAGMILALPADAAEVHVVP